MTERQVDLMSFEVAKELIQAEMVEAEIDRLADLFRRTILADLGTEDQLDVEVHAKLKEMDAEMRTRGVDYADMFEKVKKMLIRERKLVL